MAKDRSIADKRIERAYYDLCSGIPINVMDVGKVFQHGRELIELHNVNDEALAFAIRAFVETIRTD